MSGYQNVVIDTGFVPVIPSFPNKDPSDNLGYGIDFGQLLAIDGDKIDHLISLTSTPSGLVVADFAVVGSIISFRAEGGTAGVRYRVDVSIFTAGGNTYNRSVMMPVVNL